VSRREASGTMADDRDEDEVVESGSEVPGVQEDGGEGDLVRRSGRHDGPVHPEGRRSGQQQGVNARLTASATRKGREYRDHGFLSRLLFALKWAWFGAVVASLGFIGGTGIWLGSQDVLWPVSLTAQILGGFFGMTGVATLVGAMLMIVNPKVLFPPYPEYDKRVIAYMTAAAVAGCFITLTIVVHSFRYEELKALGYGILALLCLVLAVQTLPRAWPNITKWVAP
jgi:hypothetical protein